jgi:hypothetical protein
VSTAKIETLSCARCDKEFERYTTSRTSRYCGRACQSRASNERTNARRAPTGNVLGRPKKPQATYIAGDAFRVNLPQQNRASQAPRYASFGVRASPRLRGETLDWIACNDVTRKVVIAGKNANANALGFVIKIESPGLCVDLGQSPLRVVPAHDDGWWGRVKDGATEFAFGPCTTPERAQAATEAFLRRDPLLTPKGNERYRKGSLWSLIGGR